MGHAFARFLGALGSILGLLLLPFTLLEPSKGFTEFDAQVQPLIDQVRAIWALSPLIGLAGVFVIKRHGKTGGLVFLSAGLLPWAAAPFWPYPWYYPIVPYSVWIYSPLLILAGVLALLNWPPPYKGDNLDISPPDREVNMNYRAFLKMRIVLVLRRRWYHGFREHYR